MNSTATGSHFDTSFQVIWPANAEFSRRAFSSRASAVAFPTPAPISLAGVEIPQENWFQCVALYKWPDGLIETVGFCNWIRCGEVYLEGGLCVKGSFYKRLPRDHWKECRTRGGVAQLMMEAGAARLNDLPAWFGYCGDKRALIVDRRVGFKDTAYPYLIAKWFKDLPAAEQDQLSAKIAQIGPF